jgi:hypothetical protein
MRWDEVPTPNQENVTTSRIIGETGLKLLVHPNPAMDPERGMT